MQGEEAWMCQWSVSEIQEEVQLMESLRRNRYGLL